MAKNKKESTTSVGVVSPIADYADGLATFYLAPHLGRNYPVRRDGDMISVSLEDDGFPPEDPEDPENPGDPDPGDTDPGKPGGPRNAPTLMDIELISNEVVYDAANNPTAKVTFKVRNSSGGPVKAVNVLVEKR
jgi:hypothetical protein